MVLGGLHCWGLLWVHAVCGDTVHVMTKYAIVTHIRNKIQRIEQLRAKLLTQDVLAAERLEAASQALRQVLAKIYE